MSNYQTAAEAIAASASHDTITFCTDTRANRETLMVECDDSVEANGVIEYWANTDGNDEGMDWRVHIRTSDAD